MQATKCGYCGFILRGSCGTILEELSQKKRDAVDSYLEQLGDILRRLPYIRRRNLQRKILDIAIEEEDVMFAERENAN